MTSEEKQLHDLEVEENLALALLTSIRKRKAALPKAEKKVSDKVAQFTAISKAIIEKRHKKNKAA